MGDLTDLLVVVAEVVGQEDPADLDDGGAFLQPGVAHDGVHADLVRVGAHVGAGSLGERPHVRILLQH